MTEICNFDYSAKNEPQRYGKEWWQDFANRVKHYYESPEHNAPEPIIVRSVKDWDALDGRWTWPKHNP